MSIDAITLFNSACVTSSAGGSTVFWLEVVDSVAVAADVDVADEDGGAVVDGGGAAAALL